MLEAYTIFKMIYEPHTRVEIYRLGKMFMFETLETALEFYRQNENLSDDVDTVFMHGKWYIGYARSGRWIERLSIYSMTGLLEKMDKYK